MWLLLEARDAPQGALGSLAGWSPCSSLSPPRGAGLLAVPPRGHQSRWPDHSPTHHHLCHFHQDVSDPSPGISFCD